jgi:hypothetical protein
MASHCSNRIDQCTGISPEVLVVDDIVFLVLDELPDFGRELAAARGSGGS